MNRTQHTYYHHIPSPHSNPSLLSLSPSSPRLPLSFIELGRVALINYGPDRNKLCTIINVVDQSRVLVEGPSADPTQRVSRQMLPFRRLSLTPFKVAILVEPRASTLRKALDAADVDAKWAATGWAKKIATKAKRASLNDFQRFQVMVLRKKVRGRGSSRGRVLCSRGRGRGPRARVRSKPRACARRGGETRKCVVAGVGSGIG